jgi:hypothetical protein
MDSPRARLQEVYEDLGSLLEHPESVGMGLHAPELLVRTVTAMRDKLQKAIVELSQDRSEEDLSSELSEDSA